MEVGSEGGSSNPVSDLDSDPDMNQLFNVPRCWCAGEWDGAKGKPSDSATSALMSMNGTCVEGERGEGLPRVDGAVQGRTDGVGDSVEDRGEL